MSSFLSSVAGAFAEALQPLTTSLNNRSEFEMLLANLGWDSDISHESMPSIREVLDLGELLKEINDLYYELKNGNRNELEIGAELFEMIGNLSEKIRVLGAANNASLSHPLDKQAFWDELFVSLTGFLLVNYLEKKQPFLFAILHFFDIIEFRKIEQNSAGKLNFIQSKLNWERLPDLLVSPKKLFEDAYSWQDEFDHVKLLNVLERLFLAFRLDVKNVLPRKSLSDSYLLGSRILQDKTHELEVLILNGISPSDNSFWKFGFCLLPVSSPAKSNEPPKGLMVVPQLQGKFQQTIPLSNALKFTLTEGFYTENSIRAIIYPGSVSLETSFPDTLIDASITFSYQPEEPLLLFGSPYGNRVIVDGYKITYGINGPVNDPEIIFEIATGDNIIDGIKPQVKFVFQPDEGDGFIQKIWGTQKAMEAGFDGFIRWSSKHGFLFDGQIALQLNKSLHYSLGPVEINSLYLGVETKNSGFNTNISLGFKVGLGPLIILIDKIGMALSLTPKSAGAFANIDLQFGFIPPSGVGLTIDSGGIKGGGFLNLDADKGEYFGALELEFKDMFSMKAYGIINTKLPDGSSGFSLLIVITAEFTPIQLGFGFTLNGVGGLLGLNRTTRVDVLKEGIKTNAIKSILFPENVVANISRIISDIKQVFPTQPGHFLIAPMAKIGWGTPTIITLELGLLIEIPSSRLIILGVLRALLPEEEKPLLKLQVNFIGEIDFENKTISFDAILYDSTLLTFTLAGQMALRIAWGDKPVFVLSVGGFHPAFKEIPKGLEAMQRITINLINTSDVKITIQNYFAVTSNTVQFGAKAELLAAHGSWNIYGSIGYDVLFQFDPFKFIADFSAGIALRRHESVVMGIRVSGTLAGPSPWDAKGSASVSFFFFSISIPFHKSWGDNAAAGEIEKLDLIQMLIALIDDNRSWSAVIPSKKNLHVSIKAIPVEEGTLVIHPFGILTLSERLLPLGIDIDKIGTKLPKNDRHFDIVPTDPALIWEPVREQFAPANFLKMSDSDKLARPSFESMLSGFKITGSESLMSPMLINKSVGYEFSYLGRKKTAGKNKYNFGRDGFRKNTGAAVAKSPLSYTGKRVSVNSPEMIVVEEEGFVVANTSNMQLHDENIAATSYTEALQYHQQLLRIDPSLKDKLQVLSTVELQLN